MLSAEAYDVGREGAEESLRIAEKGTMAESVAWLKTERGRKA